jgi:hypothetical protein
MVWIRRLQGAGMPLSVGLESQRNPSETAEDQNPIKDEVECISGIKHAEAMTEKGSSKCEPREKKILLPTVFKEVPLKICGRNDDDRYAERN